VTGAAGVPLDFPSLARDIQAMPTVEAGIVMAWVRVRNAIELATQVEPADREYLLWLVGQMDANSAAIADAIVARTPAEAPSRERAAQVQRQADQPGAIGG
jgi:hypothetical protein